MTVKVWLRFELFFRKFSIFFFCFGFLYKIFKSQKLPQIWLDERLTWDPADFGKIKKIQLPGEAIWRPELVLYNNADGNYEGITSLN